MSCINWEMSSEDKILMARLNRPKANILDAEMIGELLNGWKENVNKKTVALIISHEGPNFSFGASVEEHTRENAAKMLSDFHGLFRYLHQINIPTLAAVRGQCLGGGMELASFCQFLFAHPESRYGQPEISLGVFPPMASLILSIKNPVLGEFLNLTGASITAQKLDKAGLVTSIEENPEEAAVKFVEKYFAIKSATCVRHAVKANRWRFEDAMVNILPNLEQQYLSKLMETFDANEGIQSFLEKRKPVWENR